MIRNWRHGAGDENENFDKGAVVFLRSLHCWVSAFSSMETNDIFLCDASIKNSRQLFEAFTVPIVAYNSLEATWGQVSGQVCGCFFIPTKAIRKDQRKP